MTEADKQGAANWSILIGGALLFVSLFLTWSHQFSPGAGRLGGSLLFGVPRDATAWQVYSAMDIGLCLLALALGWCAVSERPVARRVAAAVVCLALAFVVHAVLVAPTDGLLMSVVGRGGDVRYAATGASSGAGEIVALLGLLLGLAGLGRSFAVGRGAPAFAS